MTRAKYDQPEPAATYWDRVREWFASKGPKLPVPQAVVNCSKCHKPILVPMVDASPSWRIYSEKTEWRAPKRPLCERCDLHG